MNWIFSVNSDGLSPLDVAVLSNNRPLAKMLVAFGAQEGNQCKYLANSMCESFISSPHAHSPISISDLNYRYIFTVTIPRCVKFFPCLLFITKFFHRSSLLFLNNTNILFFFFNRRRNDEKFIIFG